MIVSVGMEWENKAQLLLMAILAISLGNFLVGSLIGPASDDEVAKGFVGFSGKFAAAAPATFFLIFFLHYYIE